jgi:hypothetical protein
MHKSFSSWFESLDLIHKSKWDEAGDILKATPSPQEVAEEEEGREGEDTSPLRWGRKGLTFRHQLKTSRGKETPLFIEGSYNPRKTRGRYGEPRKEKRVMGGLRFRW